MPAGPCLADAEPGGDFLLLQPLPWCEGAVEDQPTKGLEGEPLDSRDPFQGADALDLGHYRWPW